MHRNFFNLALASLLGLAAVGCGDNGGGSTGGSSGSSGSVDAGPQYVIEIDIDDHGLKALWQAQAPNLKRMIREGTLAYTKVDVPTHSNHNNMTLLTGEWPEADNVPANSWLARQASPAGFSPGWSAWSQPFSLAGLGLGEYTFYPFNPLNDSAAGPAHHVESVYSTTDGAGLGPSAYVGQLPPFEMGADDVHFTVAGSNIFGIPVSASTAKALLTSAFNYPADAFSDGGYISLDGPPNPAPDGGPADAGETIEHFTIRDAANVWKAAAEGGKPPRFMFVWAFIALDGDPTSKFGADGQELEGVVNDYDDAIGDLLAAIDASPYKGRVNILFTLDHGKVDSNKQVELGDKGGDNQELSNLVSASGGPEVTTLTYDLLNEDGDALIYAKLPPDGGAGTAAGYPQQTTITHKLVDLVQSGAIAGVDTTRTITWDGYRGTRRMHDYRIEGPNQADFIVFPQDDWTLGTVTDGGPGTFNHTAHPLPFGRHGGISEDELYVPLIMWGPAFKQGVILPHPVDHADVAPTAMKILGLDITTAQGGPITAAFRDDPAETMAPPTDMSTTRTTVLTGSGFHGAAALAGTPAQQLIVVDLEGVSYDEAFTDEVTRAHLPTLSALASQGVSFEMAWNRYRSTAENRYDLLVGGLPVLDSNGDWVPTVESDPAQSGFPGRGLLLEPAPLDGAPNPAALTTWRGNAGWASDSLLKAAQAAGFTAGVIGQSDLLTAHLGTISATVMPTADADAAAAVQTFTQANAKALAVVGLGQSRSADRHGSAALAELDALDAALKAVHDAAPNATFVITSSNGADVDEAAATFYGPQATRHVPLVVVGGPARSGVVTGEPATAADIPATALFALGQAGRTDLLEGTWIAGAADSDSGVPQPVPAGATAGHVLARAFNLQ